VAAAHRWLPNRASDQPILTAAFADPILGEAVTWSQWCGLLIATAGVGLVVAGDLGASHHVPLWAYRLPAPTVRRTGAPQVLRLASSTTFPSGVVEQVYQRVGNRTRRRLLNPRRWSAASSQHRDPTQQVASAPGPSGAAVQHITALK
jgi:hypothetical protein